MIKSIWGMLELVWAWTKLASMIALVVLVYIVSIGVGITILELAKKVWLIVG